MQGKPKEKKKHSIKTFEEPIQLTRSSGLLSPHLVPNCCVPIELLLSSLGLSVKHHPAESDLGGVSLKNLFSGQNSTQSLKLIFDQICLLTMNLKTCLYVFLCFRSILCEVTFMINSFGRLSSLLRQHMLHIMLAYLIVEHTLKILLTVERVTGSVKPSQLFEAINLLRRLTVHLLLF